MVGYYSLASGEMAHEAAPVRVTKGMARHPIPVMWLARLATDLTWQGKGCLLYTSNPHLQQPLVLPPRPPVKRSS